MTDDGDRNPNADGADERDHWRVQPWHPPIIPRPRRTVSFDDVRYFAFDDPYRGTTVVEADHNHPSAWVEADTSIIEWAEPAETVVCNNCQRPTTFGEITMVNAEPICPECAPEFDESSGGG